MTVTVKTAELPLLLKGLRLPTFKRLWPALCERANREVWLAEHLAAAQRELELGERRQRRVQRCFAEARLSSDKILEDFDFAAVPSVNQSLVRALAESYRRREAYAGKRTGRSVLSRTKVEEVRKETKNPFDASGNATQKSPLSAVMIDVAKGSFAMSLYTAPHGVAGRWNLD